MACSNGDNSVRVGAKIPTRLARQCGVDRERDQETRFAPAPAAHQDNAPIAADEIERLDLRGMQWRLRQDDRVARRVTGPRQKPVEAPVRKAADERASRLSGIGGLIPHPRHKGRPRLIRAPLDGREPSIRGDRICARKPARRR